MIEDRSQSYKNKIREEKKKRRIRSARVGYYPVYKSTYYTLGEEIYKDTKSFSVADFPSIWGRCSETAHRLLESVDIWWTKRRHFGHFVDIRRHFLKQEER